MICTNCGTEFEGKFCPNCGKASEEPNMRTGQHNRTPDDIQNMISFAKEQQFKQSYNMPEPELPAPKKNPIRLIVEIAGVVLILVLVFTSFGKVSKTEYNQLKSEYSEYKKRMEPYEGLEASEAEARKAEADKVIAGKKAEDKKAAAVTAAKEEAGNKTDEDASLGQKNALGSAKNYLSYMSFSYTGLIQQLEYEGYSTEDATYAADNCGADWNEQAALAAENYMDYMSFSRDGLVQQLVYEGFTDEQAAYGASAVGY